MAQQYKTSNARILWVRQKRSSCCTIPVPAKRQVCKASCLVLLMSPCPRLEALKCTAKPREKSMPGGQQRLNSTEHKATKHGENQENHQERDNVWFRKHSTRFWNYRKPGWPDHRAAYTVQWSSWKTSRLASMDRQQQNIAIFTHQNTTDKRVL